MKLIDTNSLIVLIIGLIDTKLFKTHKTVSIYDQEDFESLIKIIGDFESLTTLPNVWTEVDNLLHNFTGSYKYQYFRTLINTLEVTNEHYIKSVDFKLSNNIHYSLGITDCLLLAYAKECQLLITSDSLLSDHAKASGIEVFDLKKSKNDKLRQN